MQTIKVNGYDMAYLEVGHGPPLVCVHGTLGDFRTWSAVMGPLSRTHRVIADQPGGLGQVVVRAKHHQLAAADVADGGGPRITVLGQHPYRDVPVGDEPAEPAVGQHQDGTDPPLFHGPGRGGH